MGSDLTGRSLGHFRVVEKIGEGGMGVVYVAMDERLRRTVALKVLRPEVADDERRRGRFLREARFAASLAHPNVCAVHEVGESDGLVYMAMEMLEGSSLRRRLARGRLPATQALTIARDVARALGRAHEKGIIHRDLKPDNVIVYEPNPGVLLAKVLDFGLAKALDTDRRSNAGSIEHENTATFVTAHGVAIGTPGYMAPEQAKGLDVDARADVYSFGVMLYEMLTGRSPYKGKTPEELIAAAGREDMRPPSEIVRGLPAGIDAFYLRCVDRTLNRRFPDGAALVVALHPLLDAAGPSTDIATVSVDDPSSRKGGAGNPALSTMSVPPETDSFAEVGSSAVVPAITDLTLVPIDEPPKRRSAPPLPATSAPPKKSSGVRPVHLAGFVLMGVVAFFVARTAVPAAAPASSSTPIASPSVPSATPTFPPAPVIPTTTAVTATPTVAPVAVAAPDEIAVDPGPAPSPKAAAAKPKTHRMPPRAAAPTPAAGAIPNSNPNPYGAPVATTAAPAPAAPPPDDCSNPIYLNAEGIKTLKRHCFH